MNHPSPAGTTSDAEAATEPGGSSATKWAKRLLLLAAVMGIAVGLKTLPVKDQLDAFLQWVEGLGAWGPAIVALAYIPATVLFVPGSVITLGAGALFGVLWGSVAVSLGSTAGSTCSFLIGRFFARDWVESKVDGNERFRAIDRAVGEQGFKIVLLTRLSPVFPYNVLGYMYGITNVRLRDYVLASWIGMLPGTVMYVYFGSLAGSVARAAAGVQTQQDSPWKWASYIVGGIATVVVTAIITKIASHAMRVAIPDTTTTEPTDHGIESDDDRAKHTS